jgi:hypothetical protein
LPSIDIDLSFNRIIALSVAPSSSAAYLAAAVLVDDFTPEGRAPSTNRLRLGPSPAGATRSASRSNSCNAKKSEHIKLVEPPPPERVFDDIEALRKTATLKVSRRVVPVNVAVKRPSNNVFFRCPR